MLTEIIIDLLIVVIMAGILMGILKIDKYFLDKSKK